MIRRTRDKFELYPEILAADKAYGATKNLNWLIEEEGILPHIPVLDHSKRKDGTFPATAFTFNPKVNEKPTFSSKSALPRHLLQRIRIFGRDDHHHKRSGHKGRKKPHHRPLKI